MCNSHVCIYILDDCRCHLWMQALYLHYKCQGAAGELALHLGPLAGLLDLVPSTHREAHSAVTPGPGALTSSLGLHGHGACK